MRAMGRKTPAALIKTCRCDGRPSYYRILRKKSINIEPDYPRGNDLDRSLLRLSPFSWEVVDIGEDGFSDGIGTADGPLELPGFRRFEPVAAFKDRIAGEGVFDLLKDEGIVADNALDDSGGRECWAVAEVRPNQAPVKSPAAVFDLKEFDDDFLLIPVGVSAYNAMHLAPGNEEQPKAWLLEQREGLFGLALFFTKLVGHAHVFRL